MTSFAGFDPAYWFLSCVVLVSKNNKSVLMATEHGMCLLLKNSLPPRLAIDWTQSEEKSDKLEVRCRETFSVRRTERQSCSENRTAILFDDEFKELKELFSKSNWSGKCCRVVWANRDALSDYSACRFCCIRILWRRFLIFLFWRWATAVFCPKFWLAQFWPPLAAVLHQEFHQRTHWLDSERINDRTPRSLLWNQSCVREFF